MTSLPSTPPSATAIALHDVTRYHQMGQTIVKAVDGVSFSIAPSSFVALLGSSGSGKSTLLNLIAGLDRPTSGVIEVGGNDLAKLSRRDLALHRQRTIGIVFQAFNLIPSMTLAENVELPMRFAEVESKRRVQKVHDSLARVGLAERANHRPSELSGGEQQRASLARALVNEPAILLADEPTGNLDSRNGTEIMNLIRDINQTMGMIVVLVTHERALADRYATRHIFLSDGKMVGSEVYA